MKPPLLTIGGGGEMLQEGGARFLKITVDGVERKIGEDCKK